MMSLHKRIFCEIKYAFEFDSKLDRLHKIQKPLCNILLFDEVTDLIIIYWRQQQIMSITNT